MIPPDVGALSDVSALLRYAAKHGFLGAALVGLVKTSVSPYRKIRSTLGIAQYTEAQFMRKLTDAGFAAERLRAQHGAQSGAYDVPRPAGVRLDRLFRQRRANEITPYEPDLFLHLPPCGGGRRAKRDGRGVATTRNA